MGIDQTIILVNSRGSANVGMGEDAREREREGSCFKHRLLSPLMVDLLDLMQSKSGDYTVAREGNKGREGYRVGMRIDHLGLGNKGS